LSSQQSAGYKRRSSGKRRRTSRGVATEATGEIVEQAAAAEATSANAVAKTATASRAEAKARAASSKEAPKSFRERVVNVDRFEGLRRFIRDTMAEIRKVIWPDRETTRNLTLLVIAVSLVLGILLGGIDFVLFELFEAMP
jgi:preprotein translocase subunit SecE